MLRVEDLKEVNKKKHNKTKIVYKKILTELYKKIKSRNEFSASHLAYHVPLIMFDTPLYDIENAIKYLCKKLKKGGFKVNVVDNVINISW